MKKLPTESPTDIQLDPVGYKIERRRKLRVYNSLSEIQVFIPDFSGFYMRQGAACFPIIWMDYETKNIFVVPFDYPESYWESLSLENEDVLIELSAWRLTSGGRDAPQAALELAEKYGLLELEYFSEPNRGGRGEPVESWIAVGNGVDLLLQIADELNSKHGSVQQIRSLLERYEVLSKQHWGGMAFIPNAAFSDAKLANDDELPHVARLALAQWVQGIPGRFSRNFQLEVRVVDGQVRSSIVASNFLAALAVLMGRYLAGAANVRRCKNKSCQLWFTKRRRNDEYSAPTTKLKSQCAVYSLRSQPCPWARERLSSVTNP
jgi:hypothetical protein